MKKHIKKLLSESLKDFAIKEVSNDVYANIGKNERVIMSHEDNINFKATPIENQSTTQKPRGLWYAIGTEWIDWVRFEMPDWETNNVFKIDINESKMKLITSYDQLKEFDLEYGVKRVGNTYGGLIDWKKVANDYGGIEISPYIFEARFGLYWYYGWDIASGCIWDNGVITNVQKINL